jgi:hypothetical protein
MNANEIISERRDVPCDNWVLAHVGAGKWRKKDESCGHEHCTPRALYPRKYDSYEGLWDTAMYEWIEAEGLAEEFVYELGTELKIFISEPTRLNAKGIWLCIKSTPAQKTEALARAIKEEGK